MVKGQIEERLSKLKQNFKQPTGKMLQSVDVKAFLSDLHNKYVFVPADKAPNYIIIVCKTSLWLKNWDWIIAPLQQETQPTFHVKRRLKTLSIPRILSWSLLVLSCLKRTRDYLTYFGSPSCINLQWNIASLLIPVNVPQNSCPVNGDNKCTANQIGKMIEFLVDNTYVMCGGQLFRQMVGIPIGTNCAPLLADLFLYSYENEFLDKFIKQGERKLSRKLNLSYRYIDDLISFNNKRFKEFMSDMYPKELTISETTESTSVASWIDLLSARDKSNNITTKLYEKRDAFGFQIVNFPFMSSNIPLAPAYGVYESQLIHYACNNSCSNYSDFLLRHRALVGRLLLQGYKVNRLSNTLRNSMADTLI